MFYKKIKIYILLVNVAFNIWTIESKNALFNRISSMDTSNQNYLIKSMYTSSLLNCLNDCSKYDHCILIT